MQGNLNVREEIRALKTLSDVMEYLTVRTFLMRKDAVKNPYIFMFKVIFIKFYFNFITTINL